MNKNMKDWFTADIDDLIDCDYSEPKEKLLCGITEKEVLKCNPMPDCFITNISTEIAKEENNIVYRAFMNAHIDPDVVMKQAREIERLEELNKRMFDCCCQKVCKEFEDCINKCCERERTE